MTKYASERIWREPDGKLIAESAVKDGQHGGLGTVLAYAAGDPIEGDDEDKVGKLATSKAPESAPATGLATAAGTLVGGRQTPVTIGSPATSTSPSAPTKADLQARAEELGLSKSGTKDELAAAIAEEEARLEAEKTNDDDASGDDGADTKEP